MLNPTSRTLRAAGSSPHPSKVYFLSEVRLDIPDTETAIFCARLHGPPGAKVWVRAWLSTEADGTLAEVASEALNAGELATLTVKLHDSRVPENAYIRIESAPLATEHLVVIPLPT